MVGFVIGILLIGAFFGGICAGVASSKGRSTVGWFFGGFFMGYVIFPFFGILMIIIVSCLPNLKEKRNREDAQERENRRLREQLVQEQLKNEAFRQHAATRLDQHDVHIGVDTRQTVPAPGMGMPQFGAAAIVGSRPDASARRSGLAGNPTDRRTYRGRLSSFAPWHDGVAGERFDERQRPDAAPGCVFRSGRERLRRGAAAVARK